MLKFLKNPEKIKIPEIPGPDFPDFARKKIPEIPEIPGSGDVCHI